MSPLADIPFSTLKVYLQEEEEAITSSNTQPPRAFQHKVTSLAETPQQTRFRKQRQRVKREERITSTSVGSYIAAAIAATEQPKQ